MAQCYELLRSCRWESGVNCVECGSKSVVKNGKDDVEKCCQRYLCNDCGHRFDDLSGTILSGSHHNLAQWISTLAFECIEDRRSWRYQSLELLNYVVKFGKG
jgi:transposase-like protein